MPRSMTASVMKRRGQTGTVKWRLYTHFEVDRHVPSRIDVTPNAGGDHDERAVLNRTIESDRLYAMDRGYAKFKLFNDIVAAKSSYVCRLRDNTVAEVVQDNPLTDADRAANVLSDQIVRLGQSGKAVDRPDHTIRLVLVKIKPHVSKGKYQGGSSGVDSDGFLRIATNLLDVPAEIIALLYAYRWTIEIFFRQFKHLLGCRHLLSHNQNGIEIQTYCAIIARVQFSSRRPARHAYGSPRRQDRLESHQHCERKRAGRHLLPVRGRAPVPLDCHPRDPSPFTLRARLHTPATRVPLMHRDGDLGGYVARPKPSPSHQTYT